ncbi:amino acid adenylation domain-containing protein, partial [Streptomyces sp. NPDC020965]|uniref:amino acid adenylation domain-containing protein n=1 Tax=Streptomyces sp. NPDC020965 TaxID=3365105 RepID=UPI003792A7F1
MTSTLVTALPLTAGQVEIWLDARGAEGSNAFNSAAYLDIRGPLDTARFRVALRGLVAEAECLRARFLDHDGEPVQRVEPLLVPPLTEHDMSGAADPEAAAIARMRADLTVPFSLADFPLFRTALFDVGPGRVFFYLCVHHLLCDGFSQVILWRRLAELYRAAGTDDGRALPALSDLVATDTAYARSRRAGRDAEFWQRRFPEPPELVSLSRQEPSDSPPQGFLRASATLPPAVAAQVRATATAADITWPTVVMAAVAVYTQRMTGAEDVLLTLPATGRLSAGQRAVPGMLANYLPLPVPVRPTLTKAELLRLTSRELARTLGHQRHRISAIRRDMGLRAGDRRPFGPFVNLLPQQAALDIGPCAARVNNLSTGLVDDIMITLVETGDGGIGIHLNGNPGRYTGPEIEAHLTRLAAFLERFATADAGQHVGALEVGTAGRADWLRAAGGPELPSPFDCVVRRVRDHAARHPEAVAVAEDGATTTYAALVGRASAVSRTLSGTDGLRNGTPDDPSGAGLVGVLAAPGAGFIASALGIIGAGAAWVPLDTRAPVARTAALLADNGIRILLTDDAHRARAQEIATASGREIRIVLPDGTEDSVDALAPIAGTPRDLAYVIFTSGSTGKPKGAMVERSGMINHLLSKVDRLELTERDVLVQNAPLTFDVSVWQMLAPLVVGGRVRVVDRDTAADPDLLFPLAAADGVTELEIVPSLLRAALDAWDLADGAVPLPLLRHLMVTGEALPAELCHRWLARYPDIPLVNAYGPTECSDDVTHAYIGPTTLAPGERAPIGDPIRNTRLYVLGDDLRPAPPGVPGELYVAGAGVGRGYLAAPGRSATAFVGDPFGPPGTRMYRSGDRVVRNDHGQLVFLDRRDHQVKVRGHRVELGEIEVALRALDTVADAVVQVAVDASGHRHLVGHCVPRGTPAPAPGEIRARLAETLPGYMVPGTVLLIDALPLTAHGKVDRAALSPPAAEAGALPRAGAGARPDAPRTPGEEILCTVFAAVLGVPAVGIHDNFFELGGDSIGSIQAVSHARAAGLVITPTQIRRHRTPAAVAAIAVPHQRTVRPAGPLVGDDDTGEVELAPIAHQLREDLAVLDERARQYSQYITLVTPAGLDLDRLTTAVQTVLDHHAALRARLTVPAEGLWSLETLPQGAVPAADVVRRVDVSAVADDPEALAAAVREQADAARTRLAPEDGRVTELVLLDTGPGRRGRLLWLTHHLCVDGVSWRILAPDLAAAYAGRAPAPGGTSYRHWTRLAGERSRTADRVREYPLWAEQLTGDDRPVGDRPLDPARDLYGSARRRRLELSAEDTAALLAAAHTAADGEINDVLLTALAVAVADWRRRRGGPAVDGVTIELEGHGREQITDDLDLSRTVGWFTSVFPVRLGLGTVDWDDLWAAGDGAGTALRRIREQLRRLPDHGIGFGLLRHLNPQTIAGLARHGVPGIGFNYLGRFRADTSGADWSFVAGDGVIGTGTHPRMPLRHALAATPVTEDRPDGPHLVAEWIWAPELLPDADAEDIARTWFRALRTLAAHTARPPGTVRRAETLPLSPLQRGLLFQAELDRQGTDSYLLQAVIDIEGPFDAAVLRAAAEALLARHDGLRVCFPDPGDAEPTQTVVPTAVLPWAEADLRGLPDDAARAAGTVRLADADWARGFDPATPPLLRFTVIRLADDRVRLLWTLHHLVVDGWSMGVLARELFTLYAAGGDPTALPPPPVYRDYFSWLAEQDTDAARTAWRAALDGVSDPTLLATTEPSGDARPPETFERDLTQDLTDRLTAWSRGQGLTVGAVLQACWAVALARLTGRQDVVFGAVGSVRPPQLPGVERLVGLFLNMLPVRVNVDPATPLVDLVHQVEARQTDLLDHQHIGLSEVRQLVDAGQLFDTVFSFLNQPGGDLAALNAVVPELRLSNGTTRLAAERGLAVLVHPGPRLTIGAQYRPDVYERAAAEEAVNQLVGVVEALLTAPATPVGRLPLLTPGEHQRVVVAWGGTAAPAPATVIPELFAARVAEHPGAVAVVSGDTEVTYAELATRAHRLARLLLAHGAGPERIVALALPDPVDMTAAVLAVLGSGAAYLPIDPGYPADRIEVMLTDSRPALLVTTTPLAERLPWTGDTPVLIDDPATIARLAALPDHAPDDADRPTPLLPRHPAYVIYTSGSTGRPKGVVVDHAGFAAMVASLIERFGAGRDTRVLKFASFSFDASVWELSLSLLAGGGLVVADEECRVPGRPLVDLLRERRVNLAGLPPVVVAALPEGSELPADLTLVVAGEACPPHVVERWSDRVELVNGYGPTEAVLASTVSGRLTGAARPPIGRPTAAHRAYVLDPALRPVRVGTVGELYVGGNLARGYLHRPGLTAARFVADPFAPGGERMYRTGDLARWLPDGQLDYAGRVDDQVQLRGFRIELGEIESVLAAQPEVRQAAAVVRGAASGPEARLVAYVVPGPEAVDLALLRERLAGALPDYMVPSAIVALTELPLTPQGKLDRAALPDPESAPARRRGDAPRTPVEEILCGIFADVLGAPEVGVDEDFFELGGHSLLATRVVSRARSALATEVPIRALFEERTVRRVARRLGGDGPARPALLPALRPAVVPLSSAQHRLWFLNRLDPGSAAYNVSFAVRLSGGLDVVALDGALADVVGRHESLRTVFPESDGEPRQVVRAAGEVWPGLRVRRVAAHELSGALAGEAGRGFDLTVDIPVRGTLFRTAEREHLLLLVVHHIAWDGWSVAPLARDISRAYGARCGGGVPVWEGLPVQYVDYALWQRGLLGEESDAGSVVARQLEYWRARLAGVPEELVLPFDRVRPVVSSHRGGVVPFGLGGVAHGGLVRLGRESGASLFMVLQAGLAALLSRLGAGVDVPVGSPIAGRTDGALDELVGCFMNTLVLRMDVSGDPVFRELVGRARETALGAFEHQDVPFERLVEVLDPVRSMGRNPLFQVMLVLQNNERPTLRLPGVETSFEPPAADTVKFDLNFFLIEEHDDQGNPAGLAGFLEYSADVFDASTARSLADRLVRLLEQVADDPDRTVGELDILTDAERHLTLTEWNDTAGGDPHTTVPTLFETRAALSPGAVAVVSGGVELTYGELNARANRLARRLIGLGAGPERLVALALPRSAEMVVALLAVLKSGAAYLPIDLAYPAQRIGLMLADATPALLLTDTPTARDLPGADIPRLLLDDPDDLGDQADTITTAGTAGPDRDVTDADRAHPLRPDHPAFVIYTSGSTGRPKGVCGLHRALVNRLTWFAAEFPEQREAAILAKSPVSVIDGITELLAPLLSGGSTVLVDADTARSVPDLAAAVVRHDIRRLTVVPSLLTAFLDSGELPRMAGCTVWICSGEQLPVATVARFREALPSARLVNFYGASEIGAVATHGANDSVVAGSDTLIGRPIWNTRVFVLDGGLRPVVPGVVGELYVSGV